MADDERVFPPDYVDPLTNVVGAENPVGIPVWPAGYDGISWTGVRGSHENEHRAFPVARAELMLRFIWDVQRITRDTLEAAQILEGVGEREARALIGNTFLEEIKQVEARYREALDA